MVKKTKQKIHNKVNKPPLDWWCKGQSLIEALIGISIIALGISFATIIVFGGQGAQLDRVDTIDARSLAKEGIAALQVLTNKDWRAVEDGAYGVSFVDGRWQLLANPDTSGVFTRTITISTINNNTKEVESSVTWNVSGLEREVEFSTIFTDWKSVVGTCGLGGDWSSPIILNSISLASDREITDVKLSGNYLYISTKSSNADVADVDVWSVNDPANPNLLSGINTGMGINSIVIDGSYIYSASQDIDGELKIINISNPSNISIHSSFNLPGSPEHLSIDAREGYVYVGTEKSEGPGDGKREFRVIDVRDPLSPVLAGVQEADKNINDLVIEGSTVYLALEDTAPELKAIDVSDPTTPTFTQTFDEVGDGVGKSLHLGRGGINTGRFFIGRSLDDIKNPQDPDEPEFFILDPEPGSNNIPDVGSYNIDGDVIDSDVACETAFLATSDSSATFIALNISNPSNPTLLSFLGIGNSGKALVYGGNRVFFATKNEVSIITPN